MSDWTDGPDCNTKNECVSWRLDDANERAWAVYNSLFERDNEVTICTSPMEASCCFDCGAGSCTVTVKQVRRDHDELASIGLGNMKLALELKGKPSKGLSKSQLVAAIMRLM